MKRFSICFFVLFLILGMGKYSFSALNDFNRDACVYYGYPSSVNGAGGNVATASAEFTNFRFVVYPGDLYSTGHADYIKAHQVSSNFHTQGNPTLLYGYVPIGGASGENLTLTQISNRIQQWYDNYQPNIDGIFLDEFGYDYGTTRDRQNKAIDWVHNLGLKVIVNGWVPDQCFGVEDDVDYPNSIYNSNLSQTHISNGDYYCFEDFVWATTNGTSAATYEDKDNWFNKSQKVFYYQEQLGLGVLPISVEQQDYNGFGTGSSLPHENFAYWCSLASGYSNFQFSEYHFSSGNNNLYLYNEKVSTNIGNEYASALQEVTNGIFYRYTDTGVIRLDWNNHIGSFISLGADMTSPTFSSYSVPTNNEQNVSIYVPIYTEINDDRGVIKSKINAQINGVNAITNGVFLSTYQTADSKIVDNTKGGYYIYITKVGGFNYSTSYSVKMWGGDYADNFVTNTFNFTTGAVQNCITLDGSFSDWSADAKWDLDSNMDLTNDKPANILRNYMFTGIDKTKSTNLYLGFVNEGDLSGSGDYGFQIYFDTDNNTKTGNTNDVYWQAFGAEYYIEFYIQNNAFDFSEGVKKWTNNNWVNTGVMPVIGVNVHNIEMGLSLSALHIANLGSINMSFVGYSTNWVDVDFNNESPEGMISCSFSYPQCPDTTAPVFLTNNFDPKNNEAYIPFNSDVFVKVSDDGKIQSNTINLQVDGVNAIVNGVFQTGYNGSGSTISYNSLGVVSISVDKTVDFNALQTYSVKVWLSDMFDNASTNSYSFTTAGTNQCIIADGSLSDWPGFATTYKDPLGDSDTNFNADIIKNFVYDGAGADMTTNLYIAFKEAKSLNDGYNYEHLIYIDSDHNATTGNTADAYWVVPAMGADYRIDLYTQNDMISFIDEIYYWNGSAWVTTGYTPDAGVHNNVVEVLVPFSKIGNPSGSLNITFASLDTNFKEDSNGDNNTPVLSYTFAHGFCEDTISPTFATNNFFPVNGETGASFSTTLYIEADDNAGIDTNTINITINGTSAVVNGIFQSGYNGAESQLLKDGAGGINITIDPTTDFGPNQFVSVQAVVGDYQNNYATNSYSFITGDTNVCITIDGDLSDWGGYCKIKSDTIGDNAALPGSDIKRVYFVDGSTAVYQTNVYIGFKFLQTQNDGIIHINTIFIDADNNLSTGHSSSPWFVSPNMGADYMIEIYTENNTVTYSAFYTNDGTDWGQTIYHPDSAVSADQLEVAIQKNIMPLMTTSSLHFAFASSGTNYGNTEDDVPDATLSAFSYALQNKHCIDTEPPKMVNTYPKDGSLGMSPDWDVKVWLNDNSAVLSNTIVIRINEGSGDNTAFSNGNFLTNYSTGSIATYQNGWNVIINPNVNFPKSSLIIVSVLAEDYDSNLCDTNFSFTTAYTTYNPPPPPPPGLTPVKQGGIYYGWPTFTEGGKDEYDNPESDPPYHLDEVASVWDDYDIVVLGGDLVIGNYHNAQWSNVLKIMQIVKSNPTNKTKFYGYIAIGDTGGSDSSLSLSEITQYHERWLEYPIDGMFWDEFGYDQSGSFANNFRARQNTVLDLSHDNGLVCIANGWFIDNCVFTNNDPSYPNSTYNPSVLPSHIQAGDMYCNEDWLYGSGSYKTGATLDSQITKSYKCMKLKKQTGAGTLTLSHEASGAEWGDFDTASSIKAQIYTFYSFLLFGFDMYYFTDVNYSASSSDNYMYYLPDWDGATGFPSDWYPYVGQHYTSDIRTNSTSPLILERCTEEGKLWVNFTSFTGGFNKFTTYYVDSSTGNDGYTPAQAENPITPWQTISHAVSSASAGDIIKIKGSIANPYNESVTVSVSGGGFCFDYIQIIGYGDEPVILDGQNSLNRGFEFNSSSSRVKLENITIKNYTDAGVYISDCSSSNIIIKDCVISHNANYGIRVNGHDHIIENNTVFSNGGGGSDAGLYVELDCSDDNLIHRNTIYGNNGYGIRVSAGDNNDIANNKIYNNASYGLYVEASADNNSISLNTLFRNGTAGIYITGSTGTIIQNNTSIKQQYGYYLASSATMKNNISYSNSTTGYYSTTAGQNVTYSLSYHDGSAVNANVNGNNFLSGTGCIISDPLFSDESVDDYRLSYSSPAINDGSPTTESASIGGIVTSVKLGNSIPGDYVNNTNTFTLYAGTSIPNDAQICFSYPSGFDISGATIISTSFDGSVHLIIYQNEISIVREGDGTDIPAGTSVKIVLSSIRNSATPGGQSVQWYIKDANGNIIMGPQQSNDVYILEPFSIIGRVPASGATGVSYDSTVDVYFSQSVNTNTLNTNTFYLTDDVGNRINGNFSIISSNVIRFSPTISLSPNSKTYVTVTTNLEAKTTQTMISNEAWFFTVGPGDVTPHSYHTITLDGTFGDWDTLNYITYDQSLSEKAGVDTADACHMDTTNFWITWDSNYIYLGIKKNNDADNNDMYRDLFAIDITKDSIGASSFNDSSEAAAQRSYSSPTFSSPRKPEYIIDMTYNWSGGHWNNGVCWKWNQDTMSWTRDLYSVTWGFDRSAGLEVRLPISALTNGSVGEFGIPNRIAIQHFVAYQAGCNNVNNDEPPHDFCPDDGSFVNVDIDNNGDDIADKTPAMHITYQNPAPNGESGINDNLYIGFDANINSSTVTTNNIWLEFSGSKVAGTFTVVGTNIIFDPSSTLTGGETYTLWVTTSVRSTTGQAVETSTSWNFTPQPGPETPHLYNTITCDHVASDWDNTNPVVWDSSVNENVAVDGGDSGSSASDGLWFSWDENKIYFRVDKTCANDYSGTLWQDFIAIDVSRDANGASSFTANNLGGGSATHVFSFSGNEKPDFIISLRHDSWAAYFPTVELRKWDGSAWQLVGTENVQYGYQGQVANSSDFVEAWFLASFLTNSAVGVNSGIPNRIKIQNFNHNNSDNSQDYCPEDASWVEVHIDNNGDDVLDKVSSLNIVTYSPTNQSYDSGANVSDNVVVTFDRPINASTVDSSSISLLNSDYQTIACSLSVSGSNVTINPTLNLPPNELLTITITTDIESTDHFKLLSKTYKYFRTGPGDETVHTRHSVTLDGSLSDWDNSNNVTYNKVRNERIVRDIIETGDDSSITNLWVTWDTTSLYVAVVINNNGADGNNWHQFLGIDVTRDLNGASSANNEDMGTVNFFNTRKPEYYVQLDHRRNGSGWQSADPESTFYKWNGSAWVSGGTLGSDWNLVAGANSQVCEVAINWSILTNAQGKLPNRIAILSWSAYDGAGVVSDYCPEFTTTQNASNQYWLTFDPDNNNDETPDGGTPVLHVVYSSPVDGAMVKVTTNIFAHFDDTINSGTVSASTFIVQDSSGSSVAGSYVTSNSNVTFTPTSSLQPNEFYAITITTNVKTPINIHMNSPYVFHFYTTNGMETSHYYRTPTLDADASDWYANINVTYDNTSGENLMVDASEDGGVNATTNVWFTWDDTYLYFSILKNNNGASSSDWYDYLAFDVVRDNTGATNYNDANVGTIHFVSNRLPEFILKLDHTDSDNSWIYNNTTLYKYDGSVWNTSGSLGSDFAIQADTYNKSDVVEGKIKLSILNVQIPNRISVIGFVGSGGVVVDTSLEMTASQTLSPGYWMTFDPDNNDDSIADGSALLLNVLRVTPTNKSKNLGFSTNILLTFDDVLNSSTVNNSTVYLQDSDWNTVPSTITIENTTNIRITPSASLKPNEFYTVTVSLSVQGQMGQSLSSEYQTHFYTISGTKTSHQYNTITLNGDVSDWDNTNPVSYDSSLHEFVASDSGSEDTTGPATTTNMKITWDLNQLYFALEKYNNGSSSADWYDFIAFDTTRDDQGALTFTNSIFCGTVHFENNRKPEYLMVLDHFDIQYRWDRSGSDSQLWKWNEGLNKWIKLGSLGGVFDIQTETYNTAKIIEGWINLNSFTNNDGSLPNRIAVLDFSANRNDGTVYDFSPEFGATGTSHTWASNTKWVTFDLDNNNDEIPDGISAGSILHVSQSVDSVTLHGVSSKRIPGATVQFVITYSNVGTVDADKGLIYNRIPSFTMYTSQGGGTGAGWTVQWSTNVSPNQDYDSPDYSSVLPDKMVIKWIRWKKASVATTEDGLTLRYNVIIK